MREIAFDTETTGFDPGTGHRVVEIGCVEMVNRIRTGQNFHSYLNPERDVPDEAFRVHGLSQSFLSDKPLFEHTADAFLAFIGDAPLVIHNASFDMKFINAELQWANREPLPFARAVDTVGMARQKFPGSPASLDALCRRFGIDLGARDKHGALLDAELLAEVYLELTGGRQAAMVLEQELMAAVATATEGGSKAILPERSFPTSDDEKSAHTEFLKMLKNPLWTTARE